MLRPNRWRSCSIQGPLCHSSSLNCCHLKRDIFFCGWRFISKGVDDNSVRAGYAFWCLVAWREAEPLYLSVRTFLSKCRNLLFQHQSLNVVGHAPMSSCSANWGGGEVRIQVSVPLEVATDMGLAILIITVSSMVSLVLRVVVIYSGDVFLVCSYFHLFNSERHVPLNKARINWRHRFALRFLLLFGCCVCVVAFTLFCLCDERFPVIIILLRAWVGMTGGCTTDSAHLVFTICVRELARWRGLVFRHVWCKRRKGTVIISDSVSRSR